ncbi:hypothetical protein EJ110_NYTH36028 [Nymphaea thermarum]|nr:hypothetical protein EJ110_NYTH36028 [Nymphaea thermarum]
MLTTCKKGNDALEVYVAKFKAICDDLAAIGKSVGDKEKAFWLLQGLGKGYEPFVMLPSMRNVTIKTDPGALIKCPEDEDVIIEVDVEEVTINIIPLMEVDTTRLKPVTILNLNLNLRSTG